jgi:hypothetical protein
MRALSKASAVVVLAVVWAGCVSPLLADSWIYDNSVNDLVTRFEPGALEVGDQIVFFGPERYLTQFNFEYWGANTTHPASFSGAVEARVRFYENNGPLFKGYAAPGTNFYDSDWFAIPSPTPRSTLNFFAGLDFPADGLFIPVDEMTWSVQFRGMGAGDSVGVDLYSPPVIGWGYPDYWEKDGGWALLTNSVPMDFAARLFAVSGPVVNPNPPWITFAVDGSNLMLSWPSDRIGWKLQVQINPPQVGLTTNWDTVVESGTTNLWVIPIDQASGSVFCRLVSP